MKARLHSALARAGELWMEAVKAAGPRVRRSIRQTQVLMQRGRHRARRITLGTRILLVLLSIATSTTAITLLFQDSALSTDLREAASSRLEGAHAIADQLIDERISAQLARYQAIATTPQFQANVEARHGPTLEHFARELAEQHEASAVVFLDREGLRVAGSGEDRLCDLVGSALSTSPEGSDRPITRLVEQGGTAYSMVAVPLRDQTEPLGTLVALEPIGEAELVAWSNLCRAQVSLGVAPRGEQLSQRLRSVGDLELWIATSLESERQALANSRWRLIAGSLIGLALVSVACVLLARNLVRPIRVIQAATERIGRGDLRFRLDTTRGDEVGDVARAFNLMLDRLEQSIRERARVEDEINHLAYHDDLTGLGNRQLLKERLALVLADAPSSGRSIAVLALDLDRFKDVNDSLGHSAGDELLKEVAHRLSSCAQSRSDGSAAHDTEVLLTRVGGDEFSILVAGILDRAQVERLADRIQASLTSPFELRGQVVTLHASIGIALFPDDADDAEILLRDSDLAMYHAKDQGGKCYEFYTDWMHEIVARRLVMEGKLNHALEKDELELFYQPKLNLQTGQVTGVEALLRWHGEDGLISPADFIPLAEETGAILPIGEWVVRRAVEQAVQWQEDGLPPVRMAVNVSVRQIEQGEEFVRYVEQVLEETGLDPALLELEITESALMNDEDVTRRLFDELRTLGVGLALDDFGTGYSSLSYLRRLPVDTLKIDRSFIQGADSNAEDAALVGSIVAMAKVLNLRVVVEGVETRKQRKFLEDLGCEEMQGYLFSPPVDATEAAAILRKKRRGRRTKKPVQASTARRSKAPPRKTRQTTSR